MMPRAGERRVDGVCEEKGLRYSYLCADQHGFWDTVSNTAICSAYKQTQFKFYFQDLFAPCSLIF